MSENSKELAPGLESKIDQAQAAWGDAHDAMARLFDEWEAALKSNGHGATDKTDEKYAGLVDKAKEKEREAFYNWLNVQKEEIAEISREMSADKKLEN